MPFIGVRQQLDEAAIEQIAVLYLAQKKEISLGPFIVAQVSRGDMRSPPPSMTFAHRRAAC